MTYDEFCNHGQTYMTDDFIKSNGYTLLLLSTVAKILASKISGERFFLLCHNIQTEVYGTSPWLRGRSKYPRLSTKALP